MTTKFHINKFLNIFQELSPVKTTPDRTIPLIEMDAGLLNERDSLLVSFNTPSAQKYLITNRLDIGKDKSCLFDLSTSLKFSLSNSARDHDQTTKINESYISFEEPNRKKYDIFFSKDGSEYVAKIVERKKVNEEEDEYSSFKRENIQLLSFVGPDNKLYQISRTSENGEDVVVLGKWKWIPSHFPFLTSLQSYI